MKIDTLLAININKNQQRKQQMQELQNQDHLCNGLKEHKWEQESRKKMIERKKKIQNLRKRKRKGIGKAQN